MASSRFAEELQQALPKDVKLTIRHIACPATRCEPIFSAPPDEEPECTHSKGHFLAVSITPEKHDIGGAEGDGEVLVFAIEVLVYTTARLTTVFVSKADSTGYLYLLKDPKAKSLTRTVFTVFLSNILQENHQPGVRLVLSLFARAQNQYLFPGSIANSHKHVLDDRGLIKWWCRVFDPILRSFGSERHLTSKLKIKKQEGPDIAESRRTTSTAYLVIPGSDKYETKAFFPRLSKPDSPMTPRWVNSYPVHQLCVNPTAPPRCLIPRFPDDPKARFLDDLDEEMYTTTPLKKGRDQQCVRDFIDKSEISAEHVSRGEWLSIKTLGQFWEMMTFRQECSAGRLVGFLWMVINPPGILKSDGLKHISKQPSLREYPTRPRLDTMTTENAGIAVRSRFARLDIKEEGTDMASSSEKTNTPPYKEDSGSFSESRKSIPSLEHTRPILLSEKNYIIVSDFLLKLDFRNQSLALNSTNSWIDKLSSLCEKGISSNGEVIIGTNESPEPSCSPPEQPRADQPRSLDGTLAIKKRKLQEEVQQNFMSNNQERSLAVNILDTTLIRKKKKT
ncbi:hypothetical protein LOZ36_003779 [Ophidiomyces ophidiicola]|nr:hypothetical protein LOZ36_003779 [Ophidiomyces ophidiicola]